MSWTSENQLMGTFTEAEEEKRKTFMTVEAHHRELLMIKFYSIDQFRLCAVKRQFASEEKNFAYEFYVTLAGIDC